MRDIAIAALILSTLPFILRRPWIGVLTYAWLSLMTPYRFAFGFAYSFPFVQVVAIFTLVALLVHRDQARFELSLPLVLLILFPMWTCVTTMFAFEPVDAADRLIDLLKAFLFVLVSAVVLRTRRQIDWMIWVIVVSIGFYGVKGGAFTILTGGGGRVMGPPGTSYLSDNNAIAVALIMVVPLMYYLRVESSSRLVRHGLLAAMLLSAMAIIGTYSRGGFLAIGAMLVFLWLKSKQKLLLTVLFVGLVPLALTTMPAIWTERMNSISTYEQDTSAMGRINTWWMAFNVANDRPIVGGGFNMYTPSTFARYAPNPEDVHSAHSVYFQMLGEHGYVGLLIFLSIGISAWVAARRTIARSRDRADLTWAAHLAQAVQVSMVGYAVGGAFVNIAYWDLIYYEVVLVAIVYKMASAPLTARVGASLQQNPR